MGRETEKWEMIVKMEKREITHYLTDTTTIAEPV